MTFIPFNLQQTQLDSKYIQDIQSIANLYKHSNIYIKYVCLLGKTQIETQWEKKLCKGQTDKSWLKYFNH